MFSSLWACVSQISMGNGCCSSNQTLERALSRKTTVESDDEAVELMEGEKKMFEQLSKNTKTLPVKTVFVGNRFVGKSTLALKFRTGHFTDYQPSIIAAQYLTHSHNISKYTIQFQMWDVSGFFFLFFFCFVRLVIVKIQNIIRAKWQLFLKYTPKKKGKKNLKQ